MHVVRSWFENDEGFFLSGKFILIMLMIRKSCFCFSFIKHGICFLFKCDPKNQYGHRSNISRSHHNKSNNRGKNYHIVWVPLFCMYESGTISERPFLLIKIDNQIYLCIKVYNQCEMHWWYNFPDEITCKHVIYTALISKVFDYSVWTQR